MVALPADRRPDPTRLQALFGTSDLYQIGGNELREGDVLVPDGHLLGVERVTKKKKKRWKKTQNKKRRCL